MSNYKLLTAEEAFIGAEMWLAADRVRQVHGLVEPDDFESPQAREVHRLIGELAADGVQPNMVAVYAAAISEDSVPQAHHRHVLTNYLIDIYGHPSVVPADVRFYATRALEQAVRRRTMEMTVRLAQIADRADIDELERMTLAEHQALRTLRDRFHALTGVPTLHRQAAA